ncbi:MAG: hypothetical protein JOY71_15565 [Acetobacteraceae bacterium]|nr:hypothetical protein [Acetobacteraceae bacterium]MBV8523517.1 hypothetical protein [Acetobacteraceae bacterium]
MRRLFLLVAALCGCADDGLQRRQAYLAQLVGRSELDLVQPMGVPTRSYEAGGIKFLAYDERHTEYIPDGPPSFVPWVYGYDWYGYGIPPEIVQTRCETTFEVTAGRVRSFKLRGNGCG